MSAEDFVTKATCDYRHGEVLQKLNEVIKRQEQLNNRLYRDNGTRSIQSILNDHDKLFRVIIWFVSILTIAIVSGAIGLLITLIKHSIL